MARKDKIINILSEGKMKLQLIIRIVPGMREAGMGKEGEEERG